MSTPLRATPPLNPKEAADVLRDFADKMSINWDWVFVRLAARSYRAAKETHRVPKMRAIKTFRPKRLRA